MKKNRESILRNNQNKEQIRNFLKNTEIHSQFPINPPMYLETEKFGIMFTNKGGGSFLTQNFSDDKYSQLKIFDNRSVDKKWTNVFKKSFSTEKVDFSQFGDFGKIIKGESEKDLIIVTRNSAYKWLSGLWEEFTMEYKDMFSNFLTLKYGKEKVGDSLFEMEESLFADVLESYLKGTLKKYGRMSAQHMLFYNETFYNFLEINKQIDKSKLKIVNIDNESESSNLVNVIGKYYKGFGAQRPFINGSKRPLHGKVLSVFENYANRFEPLLNVLRQEINRDLFYLSLLEKNYKECLVYKSENFL